MVACVAGPCSGGDLHQINPKALHKYGALVVNAPSQATHVITTTYHLQNPGKKLRTALKRKGAPIVGPSFVKACIAADCIVDATPHALLGDSNDSPSAHARGCGSGSAPGDVVWCIDRTRDSSAAERSAETDAPTDKRARRATKHERQKSSQAPAGEGAVGASSTETNEKITAELKLTESRRLARRSSLRKKSACNSRP
jgi:hypothetical protein